MKGIKMTDEEFKELWSEEQMELVHREADDSWRHGSNITEVYKTDTGEFWEVRYQKSGDGEYHGIRESIFSLTQVVRVTETVVVTKYVKV